MPKSIVKICRALYDYEAATEDELSFKEDDVLYILEDDDNEWWKAKLKVSLEDGGFEEDGPIGLVPSNYVHEAEYNLVAKAIYSYEAQNDDELSFEAGDLLYIYESDDSDWHLAKLNDQFGLVPVNYLEESPVDDVQQQETEENEEANYDESEGAVAKSQNNPKVSIFQSLSSAAANNNNNSYSDPLKLYAARPKGASNAAANETKTWSVSEVDKDKKKKKKKGTLGIGNGKIFYGSESDKPATFDFHAGTKTDAEAIYQKAMECRATLNSLSTDESSSHYSHNQYEDEEEEQKAAVPKRGIILYDFNAQGDDELSVVEGDEVWIIDDVSSEEWWKCRKDDNEGVVPASLEEEKRIRQQELRREQERQQREEKERRRREAAEQKRREEEVQRQAAASASPPPPPALPNRPSMRAKPSNETLVKKIQTPTNRQLPDRPAQAQSKSKPMPSNTRTWTDRTGSFKVEAQFLQYVDGKVHLHKLNGVKIAVPVDKMSKEDIAYIEEVTGEKIEDEKSTKHEKNNDNDNSSKIDDKGDNTPLAAIVAAKSPKKYRSDYDWFDFFLKAGIGHEEAYKYATSFLAEKMDETSIPALNRDLMKELGVKEGDIIRIKKYLEQKPQTTSSTSQASKQKKSVSFGGADIISENQEASDKQMALRMQSEELKKGNTLSEYDRKLQEKRDQQLALELQEEENRIARREGRSIPKAADIYGNLGSIIKKEEKKPSSSTTPPLLFSGTNGALKNNTKKARPQPSKTAPIQIDAKSLVSEKSQIDEAFKTSGSLFNEDKFENDAWTTPSIATPALVPTPVAKTNNNNNISAPAPPPPPPPPAINNTPAVTPITVKSDVNLQSNIPSTVNVPKAPTPPPPPPVQLPVINSRVKSVASKSAAQFDTSAWTGNPISLTSSPTPSTLSTSAPSISSLSSNSTLQSSVSLPPPSQPIIVVPTNQTLPPPLIPVSTGGRYVGTHNNVVSNSTSNLNTVSPGQLSTSSGGFPSTQFNSNSLTSLNQAKSATLLTSSFTPTLSQPQAHQSSIQLSQQLLTQQQNTKYEPQNVFASMKSTGFGSASSDKYDVLKQVDAQAPTGGFGFAASSQTTTTTTTTTRNWNQLIPASNNTLNNGLSGIGGTGGGSLISPTFQFTQLAQFNKIYISRLALPHHQQMFRIVPQFGNTHNNITIPIPTSSENPKSLVLPAECLQEILKYYKDDPYTLSSCLLVDRYWCQNAVAALYRNPFEITRKPSPKLVLNYLNLLDEEVKILLRENGLDMLPIHPKITSSVNYLASLRTLPYKAIYDCVSQLVPQEHPRFSRPWMRRKFCRVAVEELCKYFIKNCQMLNDLSFDTKDMIFYKSEAKMPFPSYSGADSLLRQIRRFSCGGEYDKGDLMYAMSISCKELDTLELNFSSFDMYDPKDGNRREIYQMRSLIVSQRKLQKIIIRGSYCFLADLMPAFATQASSLTHIEFVNVLFQTSEPLEVVIQCHKLETLIFEDCNNLSNEILAPLAKASFTSLKKLIFKNAYRRELDNLIPMIENTNGSLREVRFRRREFRNSVVQGVPDMPPVIIETIAKSCPKLISFEGHIEQETMQPLILLLENCLCLERLAVSVENQYVEFFRSNVASLLPSTLRHLTISWMGNVLATDLDLFLSNCRVSLETLQLTTPCYIDVPFLNAIIHYVRRTGTLRRLALSRHTQVTKEGIEKMFAVINSVTKIGECCEW
ncbi:6612_t:CDS:10 [Ambispora leptoticha]|uniref:Actin cytoskeleton-regulatory complex protein SLA1 n=1 Tax=Ambispora leptoticha TaxID=144679 RepID=A0A9N8ZSF7_9GLOM|nr:6612_t:CDS:10 [Ambispora leptoticha]